MSSRKISEGLSKYYNLSESEINKIINQLDLLLATSNVYDFNNVPIDLQSRRKTKMEILENQNYQLCWDICWMEDNIKRKHT